MLLTFRDTTNTNQTSQTPFSEPLAVAWRIYDHHWVTSHGARSPGRCHCAGLHYKWFMDQCEQRQPQTNTRPTGCLATYKAELYSCPRAEIEQNMLKQKRRAVYIQLSRRPVRRLSQTHNFCMGTSHVRQSVIIVHCFV